MSQPIFNEKAISTAQAQFTAGKYLPAAALLCQADIDHTVRFFDLKTTFAARAESFRKYLKLYSEETDLGTVSDARLLKKPELLDEEIEHTPGSIYEEIHANLKEYARELKNKNVVGVVRAAPGKAPQITYHATPKAACQEIMTIYGVVPKGKTTKRAAK